MTLSQPWKSGHYGRASVCKLKWSERGGMPHLILAALAAGALGLYVGYKYLGKTRQNRRRGPQDREEKRTLNSGETLEWDEETRSYRPRNKEC